MKILHISDLHFGRYFIRDVATALLDQLNRLSPDLIAITGDLTQRAKKSEFKEFHGFVKQLSPTPVISVPGNHDLPLYRIWERCLAPRSNYRRYTPTPVDSVHDVGCARIVALDSTSSWRGIKGGRLSEQQLSLCQQAFSQAPKRMWRIVMMHHHLVSPPAIKTHAPIPNAKRHLQALEEAGAQLILTGHLHQSFVQHTLDFLPGETRASGAILCQCGTTTCRRGRGAEREKNSFHLIQLEQLGNVGIEHWMYFADHGGFKQISEFSFTADQLATPRLTRE